VNHTESAYGLWSLVIINSAIFIMFAFSFFKPATARDWRTFGAFAAFIVALFVEMYGFPLTIYLISGWLQTKFPNLDLLSHTSGHLWSTLLGEKGDPHFGVLHIASYVFLGFGFYLLSTAWNVLYHAQRGQSLATTGPYARIRHPQYVAFVMILLGFLLQWPTLLTLAMFPILVAMYGRLAAQDHPGNCPKCGMTLEPVMPTLEDDDNPELRDFQHRFWWTSAIDTPSSLCWPCSVKRWHLMDMRVHRPGWSSYWASPIVLWAGWPFFTRGWQSRGPAQSQHVDVDWPGYRCAAYVYSVAATLVPASLSGVLHFDGACGRVL
jgi:protein-S-isoprenylcysteine O-methyltransferase Ste14